MDEDLEDLSVSQLMHLDPEAPLVIDGAKPGGKVFNDPIHDLVQLRPASVQLIDSPYFQRLRDLKQLGLSYYVFPGACHNRFEHSLGVAHLAIKVIYYLTRKYKELRITASDRKCVEIAGLCHDLGHGPFSHVFDSLFLKSLGIKDWSHEEMSCQVFQQIVDEKDLIGGGHLTEEEVERVKDMILAGRKDPPPPPEREGRQFLHEIVANGRNGLDVDKFDYLLRDARMCGVSIGLDFNRIMQFSKVIDNEICYKWSEYQNVKQVYNTRLEMHQRVYGHRKARSVDLMVVDALRHANPVLRITDKIRNPTQFLTLDDTLLKRIEFWDAGLGLAGHIAGEMSGEAAYHMRKAQAVVRRLRLRDLYKFCGEVVVPSDRLAKWEEPLPQDIADLLPKGSGVGAADIIVDILKQNLTAGNSNPLDKVSFYDTDGSTEKRVLRHTDVTALQLQNFEDRKLRVYSRKSDTGSRAAVEAAFEKYVKLHFPDTGIMGTPRKPQAGSQPPGCTLMNANRKRKLDL